MSEICGARFGECRCDNGPECSGNAHRCTRDGCRGEWTYDHEGRDVPVTLPTGQQVPDRVLAYELRERILSEGGWS